MEVSFSKNPQNPATPVAPVEVVAPAAPVQVATAPVQVAGQVPATIPSAVPARTDTMLLGDVLPNFSEMILPRVNLVQNIGKLKDNFEPGTLLYDQKLPLFIPGKLNDQTKTVVRASTPPVTMTFVGFRPTRFVEKVIGGGKGLIVNTEDAVRAAGGTLDYTEWKAKEAAGMKRFEPLADGMVVIERPELVADDDTIFVYEIEGKKYAIALWAVRGTSYTNLCKRVLFPARRMGALRKGGFPSWCWSLSSREESFGANRSWIPIALPKAKNSPAIVDFVREILTGVSAPTGQEPAADAAEE